MSSYYIMSRLYIFLLSAALCLYFSGCGSNNKDELSHHHNHQTSSHDHEHDHEHEHEHEHKAEKNDEGKTDSHDEITLSPEMAERFGVATETVVVSPFYDALKVSGEILPSPTDAAVLVAPTAGIVHFSRGIEPGSKITAGTAIAHVSASEVTGGDRDKAARAALDAAKRELDRITPLYDERLVTASEYNAALRDYETAKAAYSPSASAGTIKSPISGIITSIDVRQGQYVEAGAQIASVSSSVRLTLRADVPQRYFSRVPSFADALVSLPYSDETVALGEIGGRRTATADNVTSSTPGYIPVYFSFDNNGQFLPGAGVDVYLRSADADELISVPLSALSEQQGQFYVFVRLDDECYRKTLVTTGRNNGERIEIKSGLKPGENVVVAGTTTVRISEASGTVPEGHSHNH